MAIPQSFLDELVERSDIADVVGDYVELKKRGTNMFGLCPFHSEKTPSFSVNRDRQIFHCFGCGVGGGVITFIMKVENLDFVDAVKFLAARAGLNVPEDGDPSTAARRKRVLELNRAAARRFHENLLGDDGAPAREYFESRGLSERTIRRFGLGFATDDWEDLLTNVGGFEKQDFLEAGLAVKNKKGGLYDRFRNRVIFPIIDLRGEVVAFGGRVLDDSLPKYLNSPETVAFSKSRNLFALNLAKKSQRREIILAEGYMDVITLHQAGFDSAVASLGTALTDAQARLIARYKKEAVIAYDMDAAGRGAADRAIKLLEDAGIKVRLVDMNGAKDPDEFIKKFGADALKARLDRSEGHMEYRLRELASARDMSSDEGRLDFARAAAELLCEIDSPAELEVYTARVAEMSGVSAKTVGEETSIARSKKSRKQRQSEHRRALQPVAAAAPRSRELRYDNPRSALAEEGVLRCVYSDGELLKAAAEKLSPERFSSPTLGRAYSLMLDALRDGRPPGSAVFETLGEEESSLVGAALMKPEPGGERALESYIAAIDEEYAKRSEPDDLMAVWQRKKQKDSEDKEE